MQKAARASAVSIDRRREAGVPVYFVGEKYRVGEAYLHAVGPEIWLYILYIYFRDLTSLVLNIPPGRNMITPIYKPPRT